MTDKYTHLDLTSRRLIAKKLNRDGKSIRQIARELEVVASTISCEIRRNRVKASPITIRTGMAGRHPVKIIDGKYFYDPEIADQKAKARARRARVRHKIIPGSVLYNTVDQMLRGGFKPDVIAGRLKLLHPTDKTMHVSHETIYAYAYKHTKCGWWEYLAKARKQRKPHSNRKSIIKNRTSIHTRPKTADDRSEIGHFEGDSIIGCRGSRRVITTGVDRKVRLLIAEFSEDKTAENTRHTITSATENIREHIRSFTFDNGTEFAEHEQLAKDLGISVFFADPYSSWQRGTNERHNGLIRRFLPKGTNFDNINAQELADIVSFWNNYPRKILGYLTPQEAWNQQTQTKPDTNQLN